MDKQRNLQFCKIQKLIAGRDSTDRDASADQFSCHCWLLHYVHSSEVYGCASEDAHPSKHHKTMQFP